MGVAHLLQARDKVNSKKKFLFLHPPYFHPISTLEPHPFLPKLPPYMPYGALSIASFLKKVDVEARVVPMAAYYMGNPFDAVFYDDRNETCLEFAYTVKSVVDHLLGKFPADVIGVSLLGAQFEYAARTIVRIIRKLYPDKTVLVGGSHASFNPGILLEEPYPAHAVVVGEGESAIRRWMENDYAFSGVLPGMVYRNERAELVHGGTAPLLGEEELQFDIDHDLVWLPEHFDFREMEHFVLYGRGCLFNCNYCVSPKMWDRQVRYKSMEVTGREIQALIDRGKMHIRIADDMVNIHRGRFSDLCEVLKTFDRLSLKAQTRVEFAREKDIELMRKAHIRVLELGVESIDPALVRSMKKPHSTDSVTKACRIMKHGGLDVTLNWMVGYPGSTRSSDLMTVDFVTRLVSQGLVDSLNVSVFTPFPGTEQQAHPSIRIIDRNSLNWTATRPVHELLDAAGQVVYSAEEMLDVYSRLMSLENGMKGRLSVEPTGPPAPTEAATIYRANATKYLSPRP